MSSRKGATSWGQKRMLPIGTRKSATSWGQNGPRSDGNEGVLCLHQSPELLKPHYLLV